MFTPWNVKTFYGSFGKVRDVCTWLDLDEGSFLTFIFSKVAIFCYLWNTFKGQSRNICFTFEVQRFLQTKTSKVIPKTFEWNNVDTFADAFTATFEQTKVKTIICLRGLVDPIAERFYNLYIASRSHDLWRNGRFDSHILK